MAPQTDAPRRALFLDRDGTLIVDVGYPNDPRQVQLLPDVVESLAALQAAGFQLVIVSNQSGIGRGWISPAQAAAVHTQVVSDLAARGITLDGAFYCPHVPDEGCRCRKPSPALLEEAAHQLGINLAHSWMIGDKASDIEAGQRAGCRTIQLHNPADTSTFQAAPDAWATSWAEVVQTVLAAKGAYAER